jgi:hypothetical protein
LRSPSDDAQPALGSEDERRRLRRVHDGKALLECALLACRIEVDDFKQARRLGRAKTLKISIVPAIVIGEGVTRSLRSELTAATSLCVGFCVQTTPGITPEVALRPVGRLFFEILRNASRTRILGRRAAEVRPDIKTYGQSRPRRAPRRFSFGRESEARAELSRDLPAITRVDDHSPEEATDDRGRLRNDDVTDAVGEPEVDPT